MSTAVFEAAGITWLEQQPYSTQTHSKPKKSDQLMMHTAVALNVEIMAIVVHEAAGGLLPAL